MKVRVRAMISV